MRRISGLALAASAVLVIGGLVPPAAASMPADGSTAPALAVLKSVLGGQPEPFDLAKASTGKVVVLYFFPQAFSEG